MKKTCFYFIVIISTFLFAQCSDDEDPVPTDVISEVSIFDIGNSNDASDIYVRMGIKSASPALEIRIVIVKKAEANSINEADLLQIPEENYQTYMLDGKTFSVTQPLNAGLKDFGGLGLQQGVDYAVKFIIVSSGKAKLADASGTIMLQNIHPLEGSYSGTWNDNIYTDFGITSRLNASSIDGRLSGPFFYTSTFNSCCGGTDDGDITIILSGNTVTEFRYDQDLKDFMGGCPGSYAGSGTLLDPITFQINFSGNDCEGPHTGGRILLTRRP